MRSPWDDDITAIAKWERNSSSHMHEHAVSSEMENSVYIYKLFTATFQLVGVLHRKTRVIFNEAIHCVIAQCTPLTLIDKYLLDISSPKVLVIIRLVQ